MAELHPLDFAVLAAYLILVFYFGLRSRRAAGESQEGFFLAGRKLGRVTQFFLNFGNSTDANGAVSTASLVYQQGVSGVWLGFQMIFLNPYYWFMNLWFRRARLMTNADLFEDRLGSPGLAKGYALFQSLAAVVITIGFGNLITYKISSTLLTKPAVEWTAEERASVEGYQELRRLEAALAGRPLTTLAPAEQVQLQVLREREARDELQETIPLVSPVVFYLIYTAVVGSYIVLGGMAATALNEIVQSLLIVVFSVMLLPLGFAAIGGADRLDQLIPPEAFELVRSDGAGQQITLIVLLGILLNTIVQIHAVPGNMPISGSARDEYAARFGAVSGTFAKRLMIIMWAFAGLIALGLFRGERALADADTAWGELSRSLLGPGLLGLMITGILAANMSTVAAQSMAVSGLIVRNFWLPLRGRLSDADGVGAGRWTIAAVLLLGVAAALNMNDVFAMLQFMLTINVPFGAAILLMFFWRRLTVPAVWVTVTVCFLVCTFAPVVLPKIDAVARHPALTLRDTDAAGNLSPVYFDSVVRTVPDDPTSELVGRGRLHVELVVLRAVGVPVAELSPSNRFAARLFFAALLPFMLLLAVSRLTRPPAEDRVDRFYGKMKTPVGATPELEEAALAATAAQPRRFDDQKLFPGSAWEFTKWDRTDTVGFLVAATISGTIIALFWGLLRWAAA